MNSPQKSLDKVLSKGTLSCMTWFVLSFFVGIIPLIIIFALKLSNIQLSDFVQNGTLAVVGIGIAGSALGRITDSDKTPSFFQKLALLIGISVLIILFIVFFSAYNNPPTDNYLTIMSLSTFILTAAFSGVCVVISIISEAIL